MVFEIIYPAEIFMFPFGEQTQGIEVIPGSTVRDSEEPPFPFDISITTVLGEVEGIVYDPVNA